MASKSSKEVQLLISAKDAASAAINEAREALERLAATNAKSGEAATESSGKLAQLSEAIRKLKAEAEKVDLDKQFRKFAKSVDNVGLGFQRVGRNVSIVSAAVTAGFGLAIKQAVDFESAMADVRKVVTFDSPEAFKQMGEDIRDLSERLPIAADGLAAIAAAAGQAGVEARELTKFTELVAKVSVAFELTAEDAGTALAKIKTALGLTTPQVGLLTDSINTLANDMAASESEVLDVTNRVAALGGVSGIAAKDIAAIGAAMVSTGVDSERAATGLRNILLALQAGTKATAAQRKAFAQLGLDSETLARRLQSEGPAVLIDVFERIRRQAPSVRAAITNALFGERAVDAIAPLVANLDVLRNALHLIADEATFAGSAQREFDVRAETSANKLRLFQNALDNLQITIGNQLLPTLTNLATSLSATFNGLSDAKAATISWGIAIGGVVAILGPVLIGIGSIIRAGGALASALRFLIPVVTALASALAALAVANPFGVLLVTLGVLGGGLLLLGEKQMTAAEAAAAHKEALRLLDEAIGETAAGVPGAAKKLHALAEASLAAASAAVINARAQLEQAKAEVEAADLTVGLTGPENLSDEIRAQLRADALKPFNDAVAQTEAQLAGLEAKIATLGKTTTTSIGGAAAAVGQQAGQAVDSAVRIIRGGQVELDGLGEAGAQSGNAIAEGMAAAGDSIAGVSADAGNLGNSIAQKIAPGIQQLGNVGPQIETSLGGVVKRIADDTKQIGTAASESATGFEVVGTAILGAADAAVAFSQAVTIEGRFQAMQEELNGVGEAYNQFADNVVEGADGITLTFSDLGDAIRNSIGGASDIVGELDRAFGQAVNSASQLGGAADDTVGDFDRMAGAIQSRFGEVSADVSQLIANMRRELAALVAEINQARAAATASASAGKAQGGPAFAGGGRVHGPGTSISDSIAAFLSAGEYVIRAASVRKYGVPFLDLLNSGKLPKLLAASLPRLSTGGVVRPAFAEGEIVSPTLHFGGAPMHSLALTFNGKGATVYGDADAVNALFAAARQAQIASAGPAPGFVK